jgi:outer membrane protein assembly factor BamA
MGFADRPEPNFGRIALDVGASTQGSHAFILDAQAPAYWDGWRLALTLSWTRANRFGYYGQGNATHFDPDSTDGRSHFYRVSRRNRSARLTVQRKVAGPVRLLVGGTAERNDFRELPGETVFRRDRTTGTIGPDDLHFTDAIGRAGIVFDTRDLEVDPHRGVFAEALVGRGRGYTRTTAHLRVYVHPLERLVIAARLAGENITGDAPLGALQTIESSDGAAAAVGGHRSLRGYYDGRFTGPGKVLGGIEARYGLLWAPRLLELKLFAYYDTGRVFASGESIRLTRRGLHSSLGGGVALSLMRNTLVLLEGGKGNEGAQVTFATAWSY